MLNGVLFFEKQLDGSHGRWIGYIYCPDLDRPFFVNEQRMLKGATRPALGAHVEFKEGITQEGKDFAAATSVRAATANYDDNDPLVTMEVTSAIYRLPPQVILSRLKIQLLLLHERSGKALLTITQIKALASWTAPGVSAKQTRTEAPDPPDNQIKFGQLVKDEFDRGFGFVKEQGKGTPEIFAHIKNLKFEPSINDWLVFAVGSDGRVSWARKPAQVLSWLRKSYTTFSIGALDELFRLGNQELAEEVLDFRIERVLAAKAEVHVSNGAPLLEKVLKLLPNRLPYTYNRLIAALEGVGKLRMWAQFGGVEDASFYASPLNKVYQDTVSQRSAEMPRALMLGLLDIGREQAKASSIIQAWWPTGEIAALTESELVASISLLFKWLREWHSLLSLGNLLPAARENYAAHWRTLTKEARRHFGQIGNANIGAAVYEATGVLLPIPGLVGERLNLLTEDVLLDLIRDGDEAGYMALAEALRRLGNIDTEDKYKKVQKWLAEISLLSTANPDQKREAMASLAKISSPVYLLNLWSTGHLPDLDWEKVVGLLAEDAARSVSLEVTNKADLRLAAAHRLLHLYSKSAASEDAIVRFMKALYVRRTDTTDTILGRISLDVRGSVTNPVAKPSQNEAANFRQGFDKLIQDTVNEQPELAFAMWQAGVVSEFPASDALARLVTLASTDPWAPLPAWVNQHGLHILGKLMRLLLGVDNAQLLGLPHSMLLPWAEELSDLKSKRQANANESLVETLMTDLLTTKRQDIALPLLVWNLWNVDSSAMYLNGLNHNELEALLEAPSRQVRSAAATVLLGTASKKEDQVHIDQACLQILARLNLGMLEVREGAEVNDEYYQSPTLGHLYCRKGCWYLGDYEDLLKAPVNHKPTRKASSLGELDISWDYNARDKPKRGAVKQKFDDAQTAELIKFALTIGSNWLRHQLWKANVVENPAYDQIYEEILCVAVGFARTGDESAWEPACQLMQRLSGSQRLDFLDWLLDNEHTDVFTSWDGSLMRCWLENLPETEAKQATWNRLLAAVGTPALLSLWLADIVEHYDFDAYKLLVFTLPPASQILFLRKTFRLLAADKLRLTTSQLNGIVRYSRDELGGGAVLDYSLDLALTVLNSLSSSGALLGEKDVIEIVCRYIKEDSTSLSLIGKALFAPCLGRSEVEKNRAPNKDVVKGRVRGVEYPASTDRKTVFVNEAALNVINNTVELFGESWPVSWIVTPGYDYQPSDNDLNLKPDGIGLCEGRLAYKEDTESQLPFWWCCNRPCFKPNQDGRATTDWQQFTLVDFIHILELPFDADAYYKFVGLINRVNRLLARLHCRCCSHILRPAEQSDFNFYRVNRFKCANQNCEEHEREVYLSHCLNGHCPSVIDSRDSKRCSYRTEGRPDRNGMYICAHCGGCCSKQALLRRKENLEKVYRPEMLASHNQYKLITEGLIFRLYHWERMRIFCHQCTKPMQQKHSQANYVCPDCHVEYRRDVAHIEVARRKNIVEEDV